MPLLPGRHRLRLYGPAARRHAGDGPGKRGQRGQLASTGKPDHAGNAFTYDTVREIVSAFAVTNIAGKGEAEEEGKDRKGRPPVGQPPWIIIVAYRY